MSEPELRGKGGGPATAQAALLLAFAFALVVIAGGASVYMALRSAEADRLVSHTLEVRNTVTRLLSEVTDAETGQRGYLITSDPAYLEPFDTAEVAVPETVAALHRLVADNPTQTARVAALDPMLDERRDLMRRTVALARGGDITTAADLVKTGRGKALMDQIRGAIAEMLGSEDTLLIARQADAAMMRNWLIGLIGASLVAAIGLAAFLARATGRALADARARARELETEVAEHRATQETLRQAQKLEAVGQLTGGIAHDFNNLLTIIMGNLDTLARRLAEVPGEAQAFAANLKTPLEFAQQGARSAAQLTHRLLAFSRRQALEPAPLDLNRLIAGMSDLLRRTLGETIDIETILGAGLWPTFADTNQVENALLNLCVNARDAMPDGGQLTIETANTYLDDAYTRQFGDIDPGQYVLLSVTDTGTGIRPELLKRAFEPFFTTKPAGQGSGLGLAMVHGFVKQSGGHVRIYSEVDHGTTVKIYLPRLMQEEAAASPPARAVPRETTPRAGILETILLVEDNDGVRAFAKGALEELGYTVLESRDGEAALRIVGSDARIDLLFTDVVLPGISGRVLADRAVAARPGLPVLFTTGYTRNAIIHHGRLDPGVQLLSKPFAQHDLARKVREMLDGGSKGATT